MRVYVSGPMTGIEDYNYPAFNQAAALLRAGDCEVENPAEHFKGDQSKERRDYLAYDCEVLPKCDAIWMLPGWENSPGARMEYVIARELGLEMMGPDTQEPVEYEASRIVRNGERQAIYGHPNQDFKRTAGMWAAYLGVEITMADVALMMAMLKISRLKSTRGHHDSMVDLIGYAICLSRLEEDNG